MSSVDLGLATGRGGGGEPGGRRLTGKGVLAILLAFFATVATVDGIMIHYALSTFPGVEDNQAYEHGLQYNRTLAAAEQQERLGWSAQGSIVRSLEGHAAVEIDIRDRMGAPVTGLQVGGRLEFAPDGRRDMALALAETSPGVYRSEIKAARGVWVLDMTASRQGEVLYRSRNRLALR